MKTEHVELIPPKCEGDGWAVFIPGRMNEIKPTEEEAIEYIKDTLLDMCKASLKNHMKLMEELFAWDKKNEN